MWNWLDFVVVIFAASAIVDVWKNGSLFADWRAFFENDEVPVYQRVLGDPANPISEPGFMTSVENASAAETKMSRSMQLAARWLPCWVGELLSCSYCLSHHTPWLVSVVLIFPATVVPWSWLAFLLRVPAYSLAATRISNLLNDILVAHTGWVPKG